MSSDDRHPPPRHRVESGPLTLTPERRKGLEARALDLRTKIVVLQEMREKEDCDSLDSMMRDDALEDSIKLMEREHASIGSEIFWGVGSAGTDNISPDLETYGVAYTYEGKRLDPTKVVVMRSVQDGEQR